MDDSSRDPVKKPLPTIRHLLATSIDEIEKKKQSSRRLIRRSGPFKWRRGRRKTTEEKGLKTMPEDHCGGESESSEEIDFDEFSDALSHTHTEACSLSMVSEINSVDDDDGSVHAETRSFIMDRFLPAAKAMAASESSAQRARFFTPAAKERRAGMMGRAGSRSAGPLPRQSRPYVLAKPNSALRETDDDEEDDRLPFKMACGSFFAWHFKNAFGHVVHPPLKKTTDRRRSLYEDEEDEDSSSGTDIIDERAIIAAARKKAWEVRYGKSNNGLETSSPSSVTKSNDLRDSSSPMMDRTSYKSDSRSQSPLRKTDKELLSPYRNNRLRSPEFNQLGKGFLGFPSDRRLKKSEIKAEDAGVQNQASASNVNSFTDSNEVEHEDWYSGNSSPSPEISENSDSVTIEKGSDHDHNIIIAQGNVGPPVVSVLPPPLPKSPTESWLWRAMPLVTASNSMNSPVSRGLGRAIKTHPDEFDAKWETI